MRAEKSKSDSRCDSRVVADLFRNESGFTTLGAALAILLSCSLLFFGLWTSRSLSRAAGVQAVADSCALAAENEVSEFVLAVRAADATLLTLSLTGISLLGVGTVCCCVPGAQAAGLKFLDAGRAVLDKREDVARAEEAALNAAQKGLVVAAQAQAQMVASENAETIGFDAIAYVELVPFDAPDISCGVGRSAAHAVQVALDESASISEGAQAAEEAAMQANDALREGWLADCGAYPEPCMRERAESLAGMGLAENPMASSVNTWSYSMAIKRAQTYYRLRAEFEAPGNSSVEECARSALRIRFYEYAQKEVDAAYEVEMPDGTIEVSIPILPRNTNEMKATDLYTDSVYPVSGGALHAWEGCPAVAEIEGLGSISALDSGAYSTCETCGFDAASMGSVAAASTSVENGFEHHFRKVAESARDYERAKNEAVRASGEVRGSVGEVLDAIDEAIREAAGNRVEAYPPGRYGALAALAGDLGSEQGGSFFAGPDLGQFAAISASILIEDENEDVLAHLLDGVSEDIGPPLSDGGEVVLALWSGLLSAYGKGAEGMCDCVSGVLGSLPLVSAAGLGDWASGQLMELLNAAGLEPANTAAAKSVTSNTLPVAERGTGPVAEAICALKGGGS